MKTQVENSVPTSLIRAFPSLQAASSTNFKTTAAFNLIRHKYAPGIQSLRKTADMDQNNCAYCLRSDRLNYMDPTQVSTGRRNN